MRKSFILLTLFAVAFLGFLSLERAMAGTEHNVAGWAWAGGGEIGGVATATIGWISFNSLNCDTDGDGWSDGLSGCPQRGTPIANYGVNLNRSTGVFSGYAWSENIGWISFNEGELSGCPSAPCHAWLGSDNKVYGWARALAATNTAVSGGWDGWIKLSGTTTNGNLYGVTFNDSANEFEGWAAGWGDSSSTAVIGWISFNCKNSNSCATIPYKVFLRSAANHPPIITSLRVTQEPCAYGSSPLTIPNSGYAMIINWNATDTDNDNLNITISINGHSTTTNNPSGSFIVPQDYGISFGTSYTIVLEASDGKSTTSTSTNFATPNNAYPRVYFVWDPERVVPNAPVQFCSVATSACGGRVNSSNESRCFGSSCSWSWNFINGNPQTSTQQNPQVTFSTVGYATATLTLTDDNGYSCSTSSNFRVRRPWLFWEPVKIIIQNFLATLIESFRNIFRV